MLIIYLLLIILILNLLLLYLYYSKVWPATPSCISFLIRKIVRNRLGLIWATSWYMQRDMLCKVITANSSYICM